MMSRCAGIDAQLAGEVQRIFADALGVRLGFVLAGVESRHQSLKGDFRGVVKLVEYAAQLNRALVDRIFEEMHALGLLEQVAAPFERLVYAERDFGGGTVSRCNRARRCAWR